MIVITTQGHIEGLYHEKGLVESSARIKDTQCVCLLLFSTPFLDSLLATP